MEYHAEFPQYDFAQHKGYPTPAHKVKKMGWIDNYFGCVGGPLIELYEYIHPQAALLRHGPCRIHRMTFKPIKK